MHRPKLDKPHKRWRKRSINFIDNHLLRIPLRFNNPLVVKLKPNILHPTDNSMDNTMTFNEYTKSFLQPLTRKSFAKNRICRRHEKAEERNPHHKRRPIKSQKVMSLFLHQYTPIHGLFCVFLNRLITCKQEKRNTRKYDIRSDKCLPIISSGLAGDSSPYYSGSLPYFYTIPREG